MAHAPSISEGQSCNSPPRRLRDYADVIDCIISEYGACWHHLELWNEPNNRLKWDFQRFDPQWRKFAEMIGAAAYWAKARGRHTVLGGMIPVDPHWLDLMNSHGVLHYIDVVGIHAFPGMWFPHHPNWDWRRDWNGWENKLNSIVAHAHGRPVWVTETGIATWDLALARKAKYELQVQALEDLARPRRAILLLQPDRSRSRSRCHRGVVRGKCPVRNRLPMHPRCAPHQGRKHDRGSADASGAADVNP